MAEQSSLVRLQSEFEFTLDWRPYELHPETPAGGMPLSQLFPAARLVGMKARMQEFSRGFGIERMGHPDHLPNTRRALAITEWARDQGKLDAFRHACMEGHWNGGRDLEKESDLRALAQEVGLDPEAAWAASADPTYLGRVDRHRREAIARGVTGIPTFFFERLPVVGCQPFEALAYVAQRAGFARK